MNQTDKPRNPWQNIGDIMGRPEALIGLVIWLAKRRWGLSFLLALVSFIALVAWTNRPDASRVSAYLYEGSVYRVGFYLGTILFPAYATRGTTGFYVVPLFGVAADFVMLMVFWFLVVRILSEFRTRRPNVGHP